MNDQASLREPIVLAIAGFDASGRAGIIADVQTIQSLGCTPVAAITSLTFQNSKRFFGAIHQTADALRSQVLAVTGEYQVDAVKIGMLPTVEIVREVVKLIEEVKLPAPVLDPVLRSTTGGQLIEDDAIDVLLSELLPLSRVVTPNIPEAQRLTGLEITSEEQMLEAAARLRAMGARAVLVKGGHLPGQGAEVRGQGLELEAIDVLDDGGLLDVFHGEWIEVLNVRGTGCRLSSGIAAGLAQGKSLKESVRTAKEHVADRIRQAQHQSISAIR